MWEFFQPILEFKNPVLFAIPVFLLAIGVELYINYRERTSYYQTKDSFACISMGLGSAVLDILGKSLFFLLFSYCYEQMGWFKELFAFTFLGWVVLFFAEDFSFYWHHRLSHQIRILWAAHVNHHSSQHFNLAVALRQSWTEVFYKYTFYIWLAALGFPPVMILTQISINLIYQFFTHTQRVAKLPAAIEYFFNTPSHHRVHHASNVLYLDRNHAGTLIIWDKMFGTFQPELPSEPVIYGITTNIHTFNPLKIASSDFILLYRDVKNAKKWADKLKYIFYPPGWSPDGSTLTAVQMREQVNNQEKTII
jgi:sterol desaturase/sphingolipid hydroxylase (fatty acid hydroxylase superfamily)